MWKINTLLNEIQARAHRANLDHDCILRRYARVKQREIDIPHLLAALRVADEVLAEMEFPACGGSDSASMAQHARKRIEAALRGEK